MHFIDVLNSAAIVTEYTDFVCKLWAVGGDATSIAVMDGEGVEGTDLSALNVVKIDVVGGGVDAGKEKHRVGNLPVEPDVLIKRQPPYLGADPAHDGTADGEEDEGSVDAQHEAGPA